MQFTAKYFIFNAEQCFKDHFGPHKKMRGPGNELLAIHAVTSQCLTSKIERWGKGKPEYCDCETLRRRLYTAISTNVIGKPTQQDRN